MRYILATLLALVLVVIPTTAQACSGLLDCAFGWTERTEVRADRDIEKARIEAAAQADITRIQGEADARIKQAEAEVERVRQLQFQSEADRDIAIAQANAKAEEYKAMIAGLTSEKVAGIQSNADTQIATLQEASKIAIAGIVQTGQTERHRITGRVITWVVGAILLVAVVLYWLKRVTGARFMILSSPQPPLHLGQEERQPLPWYSDSIEIEEVRHASIARKN